MTITVTGAFIELGFYPGSSQPFFSCGKSKEAGYVLLVLHADFSRQSHMGAGNQHGFPAVVTFHNWSRTEKLQCAAEGQAKKDESPTG